jgi:hypothetical protein
MIYEEIAMYDIIHNPKKVQYILTDNANHFANDLFILKNGNNFKFDSETRNALNELKLQIENCLKER